MPHAIADEDWPWVRWLIREAKAGRLGKGSPSGESPSGTRPKAAGFIGKTLTTIEKGEWGWIQRVRGKPAVGEIEPIEGRASPPQKESTEKTVGRPILAFNRWGDLDEGQYVDYGKRNGYWAIVQSSCDPLEIDTIDEGDNEEPWDAMPVGFGGG